MNPQNETIVFKEDREFGIEETTTNNNKKRIEFSRRHRNAQYLPQQCSACPWDIFKDITPDTSPVLNSIDIFEEENTVQKIAKKIFSPPELDWSPEARITDRINTYNEKLAKLKGEQFIPETIKKVRERYIKTKGEEFWNRMLAREKEIVIAEKIKLKQVYE